MTKDEIQKFKELFGQYCREEINKDHCTDDSCELCPVNSSYDKIFYKFADDDDGDSDEE